MTQPQQYFLKDEIWMLTFAGAFQRNKVYKDNVKETPRNTFRKELQEFIEREILPIYKEEIDDEHPYEMIGRVIDFSRKYESVLSNGQLNVGTTQKLLNLALKYYWCLGWMPEPPHFPIDGSIQTRLPVEYRKNWTKIKELSEYKAIIECARTVLEEGETLAGWELENFRK